MTYLIPHLLEESAQRRPDSRAIACRDEELTYEELHGRARALALFLTDLGVAAGDRVGIMIGKDVSAWVALWGIMDAGAVYVPIDPTAPPQRVEYILKDCDITHLVTEPRRASVVNELAELGVALDSVIGIPEDLHPYSGYDWDSIGTSDEARPAQADVTEQDLAYIIYTSGSTGTPKGIMHSHRSGVWFAEAAVANYSLSYDDVSTNYGGLHFDLSTLDAFAGAAAGAEVVMIPEENMMLASSFADVLEQEQVTFLYTVPMALVQLAQPGVLDDRNMTALTRVVFGGEVMPVKHLRKLMQALPHTSFTNCYGPAETNGCTQYQVPGPPDLSLDAIPIGEPWPNVEYLILADDSSEVAPGLIGELVVKAPTTMRGYWRRPDLNDKAFYFRSQYGGRPDAYVNTGDLVHEDDFGVLHFHGRKDRQIKSRGYRIELDEVEAALVSHPEVKEAAAFGISNGDVVEVHSAVLLAGSTGDEVSIRSHAAATLPKYALPNSIEIRAEFPRTTSGKIDRKSLQKQFENEKGGTK